MLMLQEIYYKRGAFVLLCVNHECSMQIEWLYYRWRLATLAIYSSKGGAEGLLLEEGLSKASRVYCLSERRPGTRLNY